MRLVSLVPSLSHTLATLGLQENLVGITKFCVEPPSLHRSCRLVGGTKDPDVTMIASLQRTHIIVNEEENRKTDIAKLEKVATIVNTFPKSPGDVPKMLRFIASSLGLCDRLLKPWQNVANEIEQQLGLLQHCQPKGERFLYFIWKNPFMIAGPDTYISKSLALLGFENAYQGSERYPQIDINDWHQKVDRIFLSTEPYPFRKRDVGDFLQSGQYEADAIFRIDGRLLSWYGKYTLEMLETFCAHTQGSNVNDSWLAPLSLH